MTTEASMRLACEDALPKTVLHVRTLTIDECVRANAAPDSVLPPVIADDFNATAGQVTAARLVCHRPSLRGQMASDHYGVLAETCWPARA